MPADDMMESGDTVSGDAPRLTLERAREKLVDALHGAEPEDKAESDGLAKVGQGGLTLELRLNGQTIALAGNPVNERSADDFKQFVDDQRHAIENGDLDDQIEAAIAEPGTGKVVLRVRAVGASSGDQ